MQKVIIVHKFKDCPVTSDLEPFLEEKGIEVKSFHRTIISCEEYKADLVIVVGGDGTFLRACQCIHDAIPFFGINPTPEESVGYYMCATNEDYKEKIENVLKGTHKPHAALRLKVTINENENATYALNEVLYTNRQPHVMTEYFLDDELQLSSGVLIATPTGSHSWIYSAGGSKMDRDAKVFQYLVREPYLSIRANPSNLQGIQETPLKIKGACEGMIAIDGKKVIDVNDEEIEIAISDKPLMMYI